MNCGTYAIDWGHRSRGFEGVRFAARSDAAAAGRDRTSPKSRRCRASSETQGRPSPVFAAVVTALHSPRASYSGGASTVQEGAPRPRQVMP